MPKITIEVEMQEFTCDDEKINAICDKFTEVADDLKAKPIELAAALGYLQGWLFEDYGVLAPTSNVIKFLKEEVEL